MAERPRIPWPRFELVTLTGGSLPPHLAAACPALTVPSAGTGACEPRAELALIRAPNGQELIYFGDRTNELMCLDPATGQVVDMVAGYRGRIVRAPLMVNSSLSQFIATVREATARFPFHDAGPDADLDAAADSLRAQLEPIDPPAWYSDGYWDTFYWDVSIGDYSPALFERAGR